MPTTPQLISQDFAGVHAKDLPKTAARLLKGGSWKKQRVAVILPTGDPEKGDKGIAPKIALALWNLIFPPNNGVFKMVATGMEVGDAYSTAIQQLLAHPDLGQWEYLLTIEHDNAPPPDGVVRLIAQLEDHPELSAVGGLYFTKGMEGVAQIWGDPADPILNFRPQVPRPGELQECCGVAMGFTLYRLQMFRDARLRQPWFKTMAGREGASTQDLYLWSDARKYGYRCAIDCSVLVGHYDWSTDTLW